MTPASLTDKEAAGKTYAVVVPGGPVTYVGKGPNDTALAVT